MDLGLDPASKQARDKRFEKAGALRQLRCCGRAESALAPLFRASLFSAPSRAIILFFLLMVSGRAFAQRAPASPDQPWHAPDERKIEEEAKHVRDTGFAIDPSKNYSLPELVDLAESHNPETRFAWERARAQAADLGIARSELYPTLTAAALSETQRFEVLFGESFVRQTVQDFEVTMKKTFVANLRLQARLAREPVSTDMRTATDTYFSLRDTLSGDVDSVRSLADGVLLEFGPTREQGLAWRREILGWQPLLRTLFLTEAALWKFRAKSFGYELPEPVRLAQRAFDDQAANLLDGMADRMEGVRPKQETNLEKASEHLNRAIEAFRSEHPQDALSPQIQTFSPFQAEMNIWQVP